MVTSPPGQQIVDRAKVLPDGRIMIESIEPTRHQSLILSRDQADAIRRDLVKIFDPPRVEGAGLG